jgi:radical SAM protein with 4Fe4S-binding SPASM domain
MSIRAVIDKLDPQLWFWFRRLGIRVIKRPFVINNSIFRWAMMKIITHKIRKVEDEHLPPRQLSLESTNFCNARCIICPHQKMKRAKNTMPFELFAKGLSDAKECGIKWVQPTFFGEPLLDNGLGMKLEACKKMGFYTSLFTNGFLLDEEKSAMLIELEVDELKISIDSAFPHNYERIRIGLEYDKVVGNVTRLMKMKQKLGRTKPEVWVMFVEFESNHSEVNRFFEQWHNVVDKVNISLASDWASGVEVTGLVKRPKFRFPCPSPWDQLIVTVDGTILPCCADYEADSLSLGNLYEISLSEAWNGDKMRILRKTMLDEKIDQIPLCKKCRPNDIGGWL